MAMHCGTRAALTTHGSADRSPARTRPRRSSESLGGGCGGSASGSCWRHSVTVMSSGVRIGGYESGGRRMSRRDGARAAGGGVSTNGAQRGSATDLRRPQLVDSLRTARPYNRLSLRALHYSIYLREFRTCTVMS